MHDPLRLIADAELASVCGGGTSTGATSFSLQTKPPSGTPTDVRGGASVSRTDRETCALAVRQMGGTAGDIAAVCGPTHTPPPGAAS